MAIFQTAIWFVICRCCYCTRSRRVSRAQPNEYAATSHWLEACFRWTGRGGVGHQQFWSCVPQAWRHQRKSCGNNLVSWCRGKLHSGDFSVHPRLTFPFFAVCWNFSFCRVVGSALQPEAGPLKRATDPKKFLFTHLNFKIKFNNGPVIILVLCVIFSYSWQFSHYYFNSWLLEMYFITDLIFVSFCSTNEQLWYFWRSGPPLSFYWCIVSTVVVLSRIPLYPKKSQAFPKESLPQTGSDCNVGITCESW